MAEKKFITRRKVLAGIGAGATVGYLAATVHAKVPWKKWNPKPRTNDDINMAIIGTGGFGRKLISKFAAIEKCQISFVCDVDTQRASDAADLVEIETGHRPQVARDLRDVLDSKDVDAVAIATPNHWHALAALWAMQAGKDVYVEKPVSHTVHEGFVLQTAAQKHGRIVQSGLHRRADSGLQEAIQYIHDGKIGDVKLARCMSYKRRRSIGSAGSYTVPSEVDYNLWCGPAAQSEITRTRFHYDWHWFWDYGGGGLANNGIHRIDVARWGMGLSGLGDSVASFGGRFGPDDAGETPNTQVSVHRFGDRHLIHELRGLKTKPDPLFDKGDGIVFYGSNGIVTFGSKIATLRDEDGTIVRTFEEKRSPNHQENFLHAVRNRKEADLFCPISEGQESSAFCHLASISHRLGEGMSAGAVMSGIEDLNLPSDMTKVHGETMAHLKANGVKEKITWGRVLNLSQDGKSVSGDAQATEMMKVQSRAGFALAA